MLVMHAIIKNTAFEYSRTRKNLTAYCDHNKYNFFSELRQIKVY